MPEESGYRRENELFIIIELKRLAKQDVIMAVREGGIPILSMARRKREILILSYALLMSCSAIIRGRLYLLAQVILC